MPHVGLGAPLGHLQDAVLQCRVQDLLLGRPPGLCLQCRVHSNQARVPVKDVGFLVVQRDDKHLGRWQCHDHRVRVGDDDVALPHLAQVYAGDDLAVGDQDQPVPKEKGKGSLTRFGGNDLFDGVGGRLQPAEAAHCVDDRHRVGDDGGRGVGDLLPLLLQCPLGLFQRLRQALERTDQRETANDQGDQD